MDIGKVLIGGGILLGGLYLFGKSTGKSTGEIFCVKAEELGFLGYEVKFYKCPKIVKWKVFKEGNKIGEGKSADIKKALLDAESWIESHLQK